MTRKLAILGAALLVLVVLFATAGAALAQGPATPPATAPTCGMAGGFGGGFGFGMSGSNMFTVVAELVGLTPEQLSAELQAGKTLLDVATEHGKTAQDVVNAVMAPRIEQIEAAVAAGRLTQAQADQIIATMTANMTAMLEAGTCTGTWGTLGGRGTGVGGGMGGRGGMMGGGRWGAQPSRTL